MNYMVWRQQKSLYIYIQNINIKYNQALGIFTCLFEPVTIHEETL